MAKTVGINLGTTNSVPAVLEGGEPIIIASTEGMRTAPSVMVFSKTGGVLIGEVVKRQAVTNVGHTIASVKRHMGTDWKVKIDDKEYTPQEISTRILSKLKQDAEAYLGDKIANAVITVPAYFNDTQHTATKEAGQIAGLNVLRIVDESTIAALVYGLEKGEEDEPILVFDLGGGTFDVSLPEVGRNNDGFSTIQVRAANDDNKLGGDNWDQRVVDWLINQVKTKGGADLSKDRIALRRLRDAAERAKRELFSAMGTNINLRYLSISENSPIRLDEKLTRAKFEEVTEDLLRCCKAPFNSVIKDAGINLSEIGYVVLAGGSTRMPAVTELAGELAGGREPNKSVSPDEVAAAGAAPQVGAIEDDCGGVLLIDVIPLSLGIRTKGGVMTPLIERNTAILAKRSEVFSMAEDNRSSVLIQVYQDEHQSVRDSKPLGTFELTGIASAPHGLPQIEITFDIDTNGVVHVSAKDQGTGRRQSMTITGGSSLPKDKTDRIVKEIEAHAAEGEERRESTEVRNGAEQTVYRIEKLLEDNAKRLPENTVAPVKEAVENLKKANEDEDIEAIKAAMSALEEKSQVIGQTLYTNAQNESAGKEKTEAPKPAENSGGNDDVIDAEVINEEEDK